MVKKIILLWFFLNWGLRAIADAPSTTITLAAKNFTEQTILVEILAQYIENQLPDHRVVRKFQLGGTQVVYSALTTGAIDGYVEYTGTLLKTIFKNQSWPQAQNRLALQHIVALPFLGFQNNYALVSKTGLTQQAQTISEFLKQNPQAVLASDHEFLAREDGLTAWQQHYGWQPKAQQILTLASSLIYTGLIENQADFAVAFSTDGRIKKYNLTVLKDDLNFFPSYQALPLFRSEVLVQAPKLRAALSKFENLISNQDMIDLNFAVDADQQKIEDVAQKFLIAKQLIATPKAKPELSYWWQRYHFMLDLLLQHLRLISLALLLAICLGIPLGIFLTRHEKLSHWVFSVMNTIQTIPSIALLGFLIPFLGIGLRPAIVALFLYSLLPLVRSTFTGIKSIDRDYIESAYSLGFTDKQVLIKVQLPLAVPMIFAGLKTSCVLVVGTATLSALVGAGGFGELIFRGISSVQTSVILQGAIPTALLAILIDRLVTRIENKLISPGVRR